MASTHIWPMLKYCNFKEYSICIFCGPRWSYWEPLVLSCTPILLIGRTNKSHEVVPSICKGGSLAPQCGYLSLHVRWVNWSERMNINRGVALLICNTHTHLWRREVAGQGRGSSFWSPYWFYLLPFWGIYIEEAFVGFFPLGFSQDKTLCYFFYGCACLSFSDLVYMLLSWKWNEILMY